MSRKFLREAREYVESFFEQYWTDPELAISCLKEKLKGKRLRLKQTVHHLINDKIPGVDLDD